MTARLPTLLLLLLISCGEGGQDEWPGDIPPGTVCGTVAFEGEIPAWLLKRRSSVGGGGFTPPRVEVAKGVYVRDAIVTLDSPEARTALSEMPPVTVEVDQVDSVYAPHVVAVPRGGRILFKNSDSILHNVHVKEGIETRGRQDLVIGESWEFAVTAEGQSLKTECDFHPWMEGHTRVVDTPYYAKTDMEGRFTISNVPDGEYTVTVWHKTLVGAGDSPGAVTVRGGKAGTVRLLVKER